MVYNRRIPLSSFWFLCPWYESITTAEVGPTVSVGTLEVALDFDSQFLHDIVGVVPLSGMGVGVNMKRIHTGYSGR